jgi:hypothetical protein
MEPMADSVPEVLSCQGSCGCGCCKDVALAVLGSLLLWVNLYFIVCVVNHDKSAEWNCRIIAGSHGALSATLCFISAFIVGPWPFMYIGYSPNPLHCTIIVISFGYFLFDLIWCLYMKTEGIVMLAHHILSLYGFFHGLLFNLYGCELIAVLGASEFTNPILQYRWFLKQKGQYTGNLAVLIDFGFVLLFFAARVVVGSAFLVWTLLSPRMEPIAKLGGAMMYTVGVIFSCHLAKFICRKYIFHRPLKDD